MRCSVCGENLKFENGMYVCANCNLSMPAHTDKSTDVFICCTQISPQGSPTVDSMMAQDLYARLKRENINVFYAQQSFLEYPESEHRAVFESAIKSARIIIITGSGKGNFQNMLNSYGEHFKNKAVLPVYLSMPEHDIVRIPEMFPAINYDNPGSLDSICKDVKNILNLLESKEKEPTAEVRKEKKKKIALIAGVCFALIAALAIVVYVLFIGPKISDAKNYDRARNLAKEGKNIEAIEMYYNLGNYKDSVDLLGKIYSKYNGFYQDTEKMVELDLNIVNGVGKIKINEHYGSKVITTKTNGKAKNNIIEFDYEDSAGISGNGTIELFDDSIKLSINSQATNKFCISTGNIEFPLGQTANPIVTADAEKIEKKDLLNWLNNSTTKKDLEDMGYTLDLVDEIYLSSDTTSHRYVIEGTDITLEFLLGSGYEDDYVPLCAVWASAEFLIPDKVDKKNMPYEQNDVVYWPGESVYWGDENHWDAADVPKEVKIRKTTPVTVVTKDVYERNGNWDDLLEAVFQRSVGTSVGSKKFTIEAQTDEKYLVSVEDGNSAKYYEVDKNTYKSEYVTKLYYTLGATSGEKRDAWKSHPDKFSDFIDEDESATSETVYRVRKSADDADSQIGAFVSLDNAKSLADSKKSEGYKVYDQDGNLVYKP